MPSPPQPPSRWASNFSTVCDAVGLLAWRLSWAATPFFVAHRLDIVDVVVPWLSLLP